MMRTRAVAMVFAVVLGLAVTFMHTGIGPVGHAMPTTPQHDGAPLAATASANHGPQFEKPTFDAVHEHKAHDCAGTVAKQHALGTPSLVATLPVIGRTAGIEPRVLAAFARGPPPWTVLSLADLCLLRI
ncbi:hypothetical protein [Tsukamurella strandjordii]|uniref:Uncharacterized protein n=1 Tax=Tsukamurella strandjordii TaxID=147577 RepID=A0AA90N840_9ACTN|nr:hypothetical protein [Tsukamurella strandjordii]MDP0397306.1 hypothetical protein [Tsukamurella strandjordii]